MSRFHTAVSRRDFMKALGLTGAGLGAAAAAAPVIHDLDELIAAPTAGKHLPWYIRELDLLKTTAEIDWDLLKRWDHSQTGYGNNIVRHYPSYAQASERSAAGAAKRNLYRDTQKPGYDLKWQALNQGKSDRKTSASWSYPGLSNESDWSTLPSEWGIPNWTGTPEEASRLAMAAIRFFSIPVMGFCRA